ncbi:MAG TPA: Na+/H+ antiporter NhaA [Mycobacteriales bacterium]|jgi:Na+/H+ antiporter NhaA|nr:Na+/H+ antiporter NhaA [Mycobacteriales bacterium]
MTSPDDSGFSGRTLWASLADTPMRAFLRTESGSAAVLLAAAVAALAWVNVDQASYDALWGTDLTVRLGHWAVSLDLRSWVNDGLMAFFFFIVGLEARREADLGELREVRRVALPLLAGLGGMLLPVLLFLAFNAGSPASHGWGAAMSTDTAFALGVLTLVGPRFSDRLRAFMLTVVVVDDIVALAVITFAYSDRVNLRALAVAAALFVMVLVVRALHVRRGLPYACLGIAMWVAMVSSGVDPLVVGLAMGLLTYAYPAARVDLERASAEFRLFREQPTPELARRASAGVEAAISPNERLSQLWHPWTSFVIVPVFALANAGIPISAHFLSVAFTSPVTLGILIGYVVGKPVGITVTSMLVSTLSRGRLRAPVGWGSVGGAGSAAGVGFTVSLLIASLAFDPKHLAQAKAGVLAAAVAATALSFVVFRAIDLLPARLKAQALLGTSAAIVDLADPVDVQRDHIRGSTDSLVTLVEYGDLECPYCGQAEPVVRELLRDFTDITYVWRHLPLDDVHPHARLAAEATEAAHVQGAFWPMHDLLLEHQDALKFGDLVRYAEELGLDSGRFADDLRERAFAARVAGDVDSADLSGVSGTPTFFVNGRRYHGAFDLETLSAAVKAAGARAALSG